MLLAIWCMLVWRILDPTQILSISQNGDGRIQLGYEVEDGTQRVTMERYKRNKMTVRVDYDQMRNKVNPNASRYYPRNITIDRYT